MIAELQVVPSPPGTGVDRWAHIDAAVAAVVDSGLPFQVGPLGTTVEGSPDAVWAVIRRAHDATLTSGATGVVSVVKLYEVRDAAGQATMAELAGAHHPNEPGR